jgi:hypothetical protein
MIRVYSTTRSYHIEMQEYCVIQEWWAAGDIKMVYVPTSSTNQPRFINNQGTRYRSAFPHVLRVTYLVAVVLLLF